MPSSVSAAKTLYGCTRMAPLGFSSRRNITARSKGKYGDLVVIDRDLSSIPVDEIKQYNRMMTVIDGRIVYEKNANECQRTQLPHGIKSPLSQAQGVGSGERPVWRCKEPATRSFSPGARNRS